MLHLFQGCEVLTESALDGQERATGNRSFFLHSPNSVIAPLRRITIRLAVTYLLYWVVIFFVD